MTTPVVRLAARVLLVDATGRVLRFRGGDPAAPEAGTWWFTPGGGLEAGESWAEGAARELREETGLRVAPEALGAPVFEERADFAFAGLLIDQDQRFFLLRVDSHEVDTSGFGEIEVASIEEHRWWSLDELRATSDTLYPLDLVDVLTRLGV
jgi:8-oxo-dGTP pyrophosphatase MutT (NUDIX family)